MVYTVETMHFRPALGIVSIRTPNLKYLTKSKNVTFKITRGYEMNIANQIRADNFFGDKTEENIRDKCNI